MTKWLSGLGAQAAEQQSSAQAQQNMLGSRLVGSLLDFTLVDVAQLVIFSRKTGTLVLRRGHEESYLHFDHGQLVHARKGDLSGDEAAYSIFESTTGHFEFLTGETTSEKTISLDSTHFLMEAARRHDEAQRESEHLPEEEFYINEAHPDSGARPRLSVIRSDQVDEDGEDGDKEGNASRNSLADDLISSFLSCSDDGGAAGVANGDSDQLLSALNGLPEIEEYRVYGQDGLRLSCRLADNGAPPPIFFDDDAVAVLQIIKSGKALGELLKAGRFLCSAAFPCASGRKVFFEADSRYVAADLGPGRHYVDIAIKAFAGLP